MQDDKSSIWGGLLNSNVSLDTVWATFELEGAMVGGGR